MKKKHQDIRELQKQGLVNIEYPQELRRAVNTAIISWKDFCALPQEAKSALPYSNSSAGVGYELKQGNGPKGDYKENFDITIGGRTWLNEKIRKSKNQHALHFTEDALALIDLVKPLILDFAYEVEKVFGIKDFVKEVKNGEDVFFVRFIHYFGNRKPREETASAHVDQSGFTLHLFESAPGLQCLTFKNKWIDMPVSSGETAIIPSMQLQFRSLGKLKALCHRVIATRETAQSGRFSAVCFVQLKNTPKYDKEMHGRLQEKIPGFNYKMSPDDFKKFFKNR